MKRFISIILALCLVLSISACAFAEGTATAKDDTFDLSKEQEQIAELGIPTVTSVAQLKKEADDLWAVKDYANAATAYAKYAKQANWIANIITAGLEPFYGASSSKTKNWYPKTLSFNTLSAAESTANRYKSERNRAMLYEGLCYYYKNDYETALPLLIKALDLIELDDETNWKLGMEALYSIIGYK